MSLDPVLVHQIFGALVAAFAAMTLLREAGVFRRHWADYLSGYALLFVGGLLFLRAFQLRTPPFGSLQNRAFIGVSAAQRGIGSEAMTARAPSPESRAVARANARTCAPPVYARRRCIWSDARASAGVFESHRG